MISRAQSDRIINYLRHGYTSEAERNSFYRWLQSKGIAEKPKIDKEYLAIQLKILKEGVFNKTDDEIRNFLSTLVKIAE